MLLKNKMSYFLLGVSTISLMFAIILLLADVRDIVKVKKVNEELQHIKDEAVTPHVNDTTPNLKDEQTSNARVVSPDNYVGWITIEGTNIDYPIVKYDDNNYYQNHDAFGAESKYGAIFMDCRNADIYSDTYTLIYGHNSTYSLMFSDLKKLINNTSANVTLTLEDNNNIAINYKIGAISILDETSPIFNFCSYEVLLEELSKEVLYYRNIDYNPILLSTCYGPRGTTKRLVVTLTME